MALVQSSGSLLNNGECPTGLLRNTIRSPQCCSSGRIIPGLVLLESIYLFHHPRILHKVVLFLLVSQHPRRYPGPRPSRSTLLRLTHRFCPQVVPHRRQTVQRAEYFDPRPITLWPHSVSNYNGIYLLKDQGPDSQKGFKVTTNFGWFQVVNIFVRQLLIG